MLYGEEVSASASFFYQNLSSVSSNACKGKIYILISTIKNNTKNVIMHGNLIKKINKII